MLNRLRGAGEGLWRLRIPPDSPHAGIKFDFAFARADDAGTEVLTGAAWD